ncbi:helix-turn-helix domain-containing protein [Thermohalobacter berrensis]|uniref:MerR family transcriptional regulator n=1 Tax=Thermohalobacter berrensis TaxID=99594 RepID=A0A419TAM2_9FIRM|nr:helix-turn-helix domain-containing protein [Thermohalobacter berrensis]RKD34520.1 MerR family transcriptional regulator [Thermohalobacter berrensis]
MPESQIDPKKEYSISEVAEITGYQPHVLRYYEKEFDLEIPRNEANHRYYTYKEIETLNYIKALQEKGFTNKQIKLILNSPEIILNEQQRETAVTTMIDKENNTSIEEITTKLQNSVSQQLQEFIESKEYTSLKEIKELKEEVKKLKEEIRSKERDVLICENAKLKMKVKEKSYEIIQLKEKLKKEKENNKSFIKRIFKKK